MYMYMCIYIYIYIFMSEDAWACVHTESLLTPVEGICTLAIIREARAGSGQG